MANKPAFVFVNLKGCGRLLGQLIRGVRRKGMAMSDDVEKNTEEENIDRLVDAIKSLKKKPENNSIWEKLNSPIIIWLLSSIVLAMFGYIYDWHRGQVKLEENIKNLELEISYKILTIQYGIDSSEELIDVKKLVKSIEYPSESEFPIFINPHYKEYGLTSLLLTYKQLLPTVHISDTWDRNLSIDKLLLYWREEVGELHRAVYAPKEERQEYGKHLRVTANRMRNALDFVNDVIPKYSSPNKANSADAKSRAAD